FFFSSRRRHTRFDCDWSSDVCSSDLISNVVSSPAVRRVFPTNALPNAATVSSYYITNLLTANSCSASQPGDILGTNRVTVNPRQIGRASCRERVEIGGRTVAVKSQVE